MICPNCSNKLNYWHSKVKIETKDGYEKVNQCPKCDGYFKTSFPSSIWWSQLHIVPLFLFILVPDKFEIFKYSFIAISIVTILVLSFIREKKGNVSFRKKGNGL